MRIAFFAKSTLAHGMGGMETHVDNLCRELTARGHMVEVTSGDPEGYDGGHLHYFTFADVCHLLNEAGFDVVEEFGLYRWTSLTTWGRIKERIKAFIGDRLKREGGTS